MTNCPRPMHASLRLFAGLAAALGLVVGLAACTESAGQQQAGADRARVKALQQAEVLLVGNSDDPYGGGVYDHAAQTLQYGKVPYATHDLAADSTLPALDAYEAVLTATELLDAANDASVERLRAYVEGGGGLVVLFRGWHSELREVFGLSDVRDPGFTPPGVFERFAFQASLMPGDRALATIPIEISAYDVAPDPTADVLAAADSSGQALVWRNRYGEGRVVYWNTALLSVKRYRGYIMQSLAAVRPRTVRAMANVAVFYLDDFPSPASGEQIEPIKSEYGLTAVDFYADRWYPDMRRLSERFGVPYTSTVTFAYNGDTEPPFRFAEWVNARVTRRGKQVPYAPWVSRLDAQVSEMALHGYNHQPLTRALWPSPAAMAQALQSSHRRWQVDGIGPLPKTYVPPMNVIDSVGMQALEAAYPSIEVVAGLYTGAYENGQDREFGPDPWNASFYALPRNTSGYLFTDPMRADMLSLLHTAGVWGHFVHPDEVYPNADRYESLRAMGIEPPPEGYPWRGEPEQNGLYYHLQQWLAFAEERYPWLRYMKAAEAATAMQRYEDLGVGWKSDGAQTTIRSTATPAFFTVYTSRDERLAAVAGGERLHTAELDFFRAYVIESTAGETTLTFTAAESADDTAR